MFLALKNFKCFGEASFDLSSHFTLISGASGKGKTTIFQAIKFALTGKGKRLVSFGKSSCRVTLKIGQLTIVRTKNPCRLVVKDPNGGSFEDAVGQALIDSRIGNFELGYVSQRMHKSFVSMSVADKLSVIEQIAFKNQNVEELREKCKSLIAERKKKLEKANIQLDASQSLLTQLGIDTDVGEIDEKLLQREIDENESLLDKLTMNLGRLKDSVSKRQHWIDSLNRLPKIDEEIETESNLIEKISQMTIIQEQSRELESLSASGYSLDEIDSMIVETKRMTELEFNAKRYPEIVDALRNKENKWRNKYVILECPKCGSKLGQFENVLKEHDSLMESCSAEKAIKAAEKLSNLRSREKDLKPIFEEFSSLKAAYPAMKNAKSQLEDLKMMKRIDSRIAVLKESLDGKDCRESAIEELKRMKRNEKTKAEKSVLERQLANTEKDVDLLEENAKLIEDAREKRRELLCKKNHLNFVRVSEDVEKKKSLKTSCNIELESAILLHSLLKKAEHLAVKSVLRKINSSVSNLLTSFFPDSKISAILHQDGKIEIELDSNQTDIESLSGGEFARLALAFSIALARVNSAPMLLLDESTASLDACSTEVVLETVGESFQGPIFVIAHQIIKGIFDSVIEI